MKLQILIPQYRETNEIIKPLLDSISVQQNINFEDIGVIICNDGSDILLTHDFLNLYPFKIEYYINDEHKGVSATRNACLDHSTSDYIMFCDADDMFYNVCSLWVILREIDKGFDCFVSMFVEETRNFEKTQIIYVNREKDSTFVHGKIFRRQFLIENNIRWNDNLTIHEDSYFNILCQSLSKETKYCPTALYLWKWRDDSVCRHDPKYMLKTYNNLIDSNDALLEEFIKRGLMDKLKFYVIFMMFDAYYTMNKPEWVNQDNKQYRDMTEKRFSNYYVKYKDVWKNAEDKEKIAISNGVRSRIISEGMMMESITIDNWLKKIKKLNKK